MLDELGNWRFEAPAIGFAGAVLVSTCGVGGAALVTPLLVLIGVPVPIAIATDAAYCAVIKILSLVIHRKAFKAGLGAIRWLLVAAVAGTLIGVTLFRHFATLEGGEAVLRRALGVALLFAGSILVLRAVRGPTLFAGEARLQPQLATLIALFLGVMVGLTSIGAGSLYLPLLVLSVGASFRTLVALDITLGLILALVLGSAHLVAGLVDFRLLGLLLAGGIPGVAVGALLHDRAQPKALASVAATVVCLIGIKLLF